VVELNDREPKIEEEDVPSTSAFETFNPYGTANLFLDIPLHGAYQQRHASRASSVSEDARTAAPYTGGSTFEIPILGDDGSEHEKVKSHVDLRSSYFPYPEDCQNSYFGIMSSYVGNSAVEPLQSLPIEATRRNAELFHMCECIPTSPPR
jgi:hypothetical protein